MDPKCSCGGSSSDFDVGFAFNNSNFSDRVLRIEITTDPPPNSDTANADRVRQKKRENVEDLALPLENQDEETVEELPGANNNDSTMAGTVVSVKTLYISSVILAAKSTFFHKLFSNGMRESEQRDVTLKINASEEAALMELLNFMYSNTLNITVPTTDLLDVLIAADKFGVSSWMRYCTQLLLNSPMTTDSALLYLDLPHSILMADTFQPLADAAKKYIEGRYKDLTQFREEVMAFPVCGIEAILASDDLEVKSEDVVYDFVLGWAREHYNILEERREVLGTRLAPLIRFPHMTCQKLEEVLTCDDFKHKGASELVLTALIFKARPLHRQRLMAVEAKVFDSLNVCNFMERAYQYRSVKVVEYELPRQGCVVYMDLMRHECSALFPSLEVFSQTFHLAGHEFFLTAQCNMDEQGTFCFGLYLEMQSCSGSFTVDYEFSARCRPTLEFVTKAKCNCTFPTGGGGYGTTNLFKIPWTSFMAKDSLLFINDVLHLKAELTIKH